MSQPRIELPPPLACYVTEEELPPLESTRRFVFYLPHLVEDTAEFDWFMREWQVPSAAAGDAIAKTRAHELQLFERSIEQELQNNGERLYLSSDENQLIRAAMGDDEGLEEY